MSHHAQMTIERVVSSLEMTSPHQLVPAPDHQMVLKSWEGSPQELAALHDEIAAPHRWPSLNWTAQEWHRRLTATQFRWQVFTVDDSVVGVLELEAQGNAQVEITVFGLRPARQGRGLGSAALTLAVQAAWNGFGDTATVERIWLHTSTRDAHAH